MIVDRFELIAWATAEIEQARNALEASDVGDDRYRGRIDAHRALLAKLTDAPKNTAPEPVDYGFGSRSPGY